MLSHLTSHRVPEVWEVLHHAKVLNDELRFCRVVNFTAQQLCTPRQPRTEWRLEELSSWHDRPVRPMESPGVMLTLRFVVL